MIEFIVFDLGGVLIDWNGTTPLVHLTDGRITPGEARRFWFRSPWVARFETGRCTPREFAEGVIDELSLDLSPDRFLREFASWNHGFYPGAKELLSQLRKRFRLGCLTNNNPLYIESLVTEHGLDREFDHLFISCETGLLKPTPDAFRHVLRTVAVEASRVLFFDDNVECVATARYLGMQARKVAGIDEVERSVVELGMLGGRAPES